jgi:PAS domain S-box-containing protein
VGHSVILSNGKTRWQQWTHRAIFDKQNRLIEFQSAGRDTTDLKRAEDALKKANEELERRVKERTVDLTRANLKLKQEIEERTRIEENLRENQERYELAVTAGRVGVWSWNLITNEISRDPILKTMLGYADHEMSNQHEDWTQHMHPEDTHRAKSQAKAYLEGLIPQYEIEYRMLHKDGSVFWFLTRGSAIRDINGIPNRMIGTDTDITALKRTEEALRESEARFRALTESAASAIFIVKGDRFCYLNPAAESVLGYSKHELISMRFWDPVHPDMRDRVKEWGLNRTLAEELPARYEIKIVDKYGTTRWVDYTATRTEYEGQPAILGTAFNITDRKRAEEMIRTSLQEKEVLLREIHHRVKNNLQIISSLLDMSRMRIKNPGAVDILADARAKIHTMALIHMQLYQSDRLNQIDMEGHIRKLTTYLSRVYTGSGQSIAVGIDASNVCLSISQAIPLALALNELISNAFKHAFKNGEPGTVEIRAARQSNGLVTIKVKDDGIGVPANIDIESADTLGLKLVRNLVRKQLVGNIFFQRDSGTEIVIEFKG